MGRIRTVKPELFLHDGLYDEEEQTGLPIRLAFIGLFTVADREGRFPWKPRQLKAQILPYDPINFELVLHALKRSGFIDHYQVDGKEYGVISSFLNHQIINARESQSKLPGIEQGSVIEVHAPECTSPVTDLHVHARACTSPVTTTHVHAPECTSRETEVDVHARGEGKGKEGKGREGVVSNDTCPADAEPVAVKANHAEKINAVFVHWQTVLNHPQAKLDEKRKRFIRNALKSGYDVGQLKQAVDGCSRTPHNMGDNDRHQVYDGIHIIFKDADQIDRFIRNSGNQLVSNMSRAGRSAQAAGDALMAEMFGDSDGH